MSVLSTVTPKPHDGTRWRGTLPTETIAHVRPFFAEIGLTRVANLTGLDRIGIPVWQAVRPASRGLSVSQGKGVDDDFARASAVMESIEQHHAEFTSLAVRLESYAHLARRGAVVDPDLVARSGASTFTPTRLLPWVEATDLATDERVWVPYESVHANTMLPRMPGSGAFACTTNGLASGNTVAEAVLHGLCEVIERDAHALWNVGEEWSSATTRVDLASVFHPTAVALLDRYDAAGIDVALWDMTSDLDLATYRCVITDRQADAELNPVPASYGAGTHPDPAISLTRALTEAAQSRLTAIAGTRDDLTRAQYDLISAAAAVTLHREIATREERPVDAGARLSRSTDTVEDDVGVVLDQLRAAGLPQALFVDLSRPGWPVSVVRVIVPGLEGASTSESYRPGPRAAAHHRRLHEQLAGSPGAGP